MSEIQAFPMRPSLVSRLTAVIARRPLAAVAAVVDVDDDYAVHGGRRGPGARRNLMSEFDEAAVNAAVIEQDAKES